MLLICASFTTFASQVVLFSMCQEFWEELCSGKEMKSQIRWPQWLYGLPPRICALEFVNKFDNDYFCIPDDKVTNHFQKVLNFLSTCVSLKIGIVLNLDLGNTL